MAYLTTGTIEIKDGQVRFLLPVFIGGADGYALRCDFVSDARDFLEISFRAPIKPLAERYANFKRRLNAALAKQEAC